MKGTMMKLVQSESDESCLAVAVGSGSSAAELVNGIALRANLPAINAAIGTAPSGELTERVAVVAWVMRAVGVTIDDISAVTSEIAAMISVPQGGS
jgi:methyl-accepting chemotaxis protein